MELDVFKCCDTSLDLELQAHESNHVSQFWYALATLCDHIS